MEIYKGTATFSGIAIGKILYYSRGEYQIRQCLVSNIKKEIREEVKELVDNLINDPSTRSLFRPAYLKRRKYEEDLANCLNAQNILAENEPNEDPELDQDFYDNI